MACVCTSQTLAGLCKPCEGSLGGIVEVYIADYVADAYIASAGVVTGFSSSISSATTPFYKYQFRKNTGSMTSTLNVSDENGNSVTTEVSLVFSKMQSKSRMEMVALSQKDLMAIVLDANGKYWALGKDTPINVNSANGETGVNRTDGNRYNISLEDFAQEFPMELSADAVEALKGLIVEGTN